MAGFASADGVTVNRAVASAPARTLTGALTSHPSGVFRESLPAGTPCPGAASDTSTVNGSPGAAAKSSGVMRNVVPSGSPPGSGIVAPKKSDSSLSPSGVPFGCIGTTDWRTPKRRHEASHGSFCMTLAWVGCARPPSRPTCAQVLGVPAGTPAVFPATQV